MVSVNVSRAAGPAIAGFVIAAWGVPPVFALNAVLTTVLVIVLVLWRRPAADRGERERFLPALRAGGRYVRHEPVVRTILLRFVTFVFPAGAVWALLPLSASRQLGLAASGYGIMFAALGAGAVVGALGLGTLKRHLSSNIILAVAVTCSWSLAEASSPFRNTHVCGSLQRTGVTGRRGVPGQARAAAVAGEGLAIPVVVRRIQAVIAT
jgi:MFS family permease